MMLALYQNLQKKKINFKIINKLPYLMINLNHILINLKMNAFNLNPTLIFLIKLMILRSKYKVINKVQPNQLKK